MHIHLKLMKIKLFFVFWTLFSLLLFSQQHAEFVKIKNYFDNHEMQVRKEFKKLLTDEKNPFKQTLLKNEYFHFIKKMDSVRNVSYLNALIKVRNEEVLGQNNFYHEAYANESSKSSIKSSNQKLNSDDPIIPDKDATYPGGIEKLRQEFSSLIYIDSVKSEKGSVKSTVTFIVERDGSLSGVKAEGNSNSLNTQAEIAMYLLSKKFSPSIIRGEPVRSRFRFPITMNFE